MNVEAFPSNKSISTIDSIAELIPEHLWVHGGVIEVVSEEQHAEQLQLLLPSLAKLTQGGRWLAWVASPFRCTSENLEQLDTDPYRLLQIHPGKQSHHLNVVGKALSTGRCCAVMAWSKHHNDQELQQLKLAARSGNAIGVLFCQPSSRKNTHCSADLQIRLQRRPEGLAIVLTAPHFLGQKVYYYRINKQAAGNIITEQPAHQPLATQLSFF